jgi:hypothetical protein
MHDQAKFSPDESLKLIQDMIGKSKAQINDNGYYFLMWGWLVLLSALLQYVLFVWVKVNWHYMAWLLIIPAMVFTIVRSIRQEKKRAVVTYVDESMRALWKGIGISFNAMMAIFFIIGWQQAYPFFVLAYGTGTFISGGILRFRPLQIGGAICWVLAVVTALLPYAEQILMLGLAVLISYLIPGYMLQKQLRKTK